MFPIGIVKYKGEDAGAEVAGEEPEMDAEADEMRMQRPYHPLQVKQYPRYERRGSDGAGGRAIAGPLHGNGRIRNRSCRMRMRRSFSRSRCPRAVLARSVPFPQPAPQAEATSQAEPESLIELEDQRNMELVAESEFLMDLAIPGLFGEPESEETLLTMEVSPDGELRTFDGRDVCLEQQLIDVADDEYDISIVHDWMCHANSGDEDLNDDLVFENGNPDVNDASRLQTTVRTAIDQPADDDELPPNLIHVIRQNEEESDKQVRELTSSKNYFDFTWSSRVETFTGKREVFTGTPGPTFPVTSSSRPVDIFYKMIDDDFIEMLVTETNRCADQKLTRLRQAPSISKYSRFFRWKPTDRNEMITFLAVIILQGLYHKTEEEAYFNFDGFGTTPYFRSIMTLKRFRLLKSLYHFTDDENSQDRSQLIKIRPVINYFNDKFSSLYELRQDICIDESLVSRSDRLSFSQRIYSKADKLGNKTYELCESSSGYLWKFFVYCGTDRPKRTDFGEPIDSDSGQSEEDGQDRHIDSPDMRGDGVGHNRGQDDGSSEVRPSNATAKIVYELMQPLLYKGHTLILDSFYNSPLLARCLKRDGRTDVYGTLRLNREFVPDSIKSKTKGDIIPGEALVTYTTDLAVMLWRDSVLVSMISTYHPIETCSVSRYDRIKYKPTIVLDYNKSMVGVARRNQYLADQPFERLKNKSWYKKLFLRLYNAALFNSFVIYTHNDTHKITHRQFRTMLAEDLMRIHRQIDIMKEPRLLPQTVTKKTETPHTAKLLMTRKQTHTFVEGEHFPASTNSKNTRCWLCSKKKKKPKRTPYKCPACNTNLCAIGCFREYHKLETSVSGLLPEV